MVNNGYIMVNNGYIMVNNGYIMVNRLIMNNGSKAPKHQPVMADQLDASQKDQFAGEFLHSSTKIGHYPSLAN